MAVAAGLAAVYAALYLRGLDFGRPIREHADEWRVTSQAMMMAAEGSYLRPPLYYGYGTLAIYLQTVPCAVTHRLNTALGVYTDVEGRPVRRDLAELAAATSDPEAFNFFLAGRLSSAVYAGILFVLVYLLAKRLFERRGVASLCVLAAMVDPLVVQQGHFSLPNVLALMLAVAALHAAVAFVQDGGRKALYAGAILAGLAVAAKATMAWAFLPVALAAAVKLRRGAVRDVPALALVCAATFVLATPCTVVEPRQYLADVLGEAGKYEAGGLHDDLEMHPHLFGLEDVVPGQKRSPVLVSLRYWVTQGRLYFVLALVGLAALPFLAGSTGLLVLALPLCHYIVVSLLEVVVIRSYLPLAPFWALGLGGAFALAGRVVSKKRAAVVAAVLVAGFALYPPARNSLAIVRQFTTTDPMQTALAWIEANVPAGANVTTEKLWMPPQVPPPARQFDVTVHQHSVFMEPYAAYLDQDYLVTPVTSMADRFPWYRRRFFPDQTDPLAQRMRRNRELAERRLELVRHVTPEECGYAGVAECHAAHDVCVYQVPSVEPLRLLPKDFRPEVETRAALALSGPVGVSAEVTLEAGAYDLFLQLSSRRSEAQPWPRLAVSVARGEPWYVDAYTRHSAYYFVDTVRSPDRQSVAVQVAFANEQGTGHGASLESIVLVPVVAGDVKDAD